MKFLFPILFVFILSCSSTNKTQRTASNSNNIQQVPQLEVVLYADVLDNGKYTLQDNLDVPKPKQGKINFTKQFFKSLKYPSQARENGLQGNVVLNVEVAKDGHVTNVSVIKSAHDIFTKPALDAFKIATKEGYNSLIINGKSVAFRFETPVRFSLN